MFQTQALGNMPHYLPFLREMFLINRQNCNYIPVLNKSTTLDGLILLSSDGGSAFSSSTNLGSSLFDQQKPLFGTPTASIGTSLFGTCRRFFLLSNGIKNRHFEVPTSAGEVREPLDNFTGAEGFQCGPEFQNSAAVQPILEPTVRYGAMPVLKLSFCRRPTDSSGMHFQAPRATP